MSTVDLQKLAALRDADTLLRGDYRRRAELARDALAQLHERQADHLGAARDDGQRHALGELFALSSEALERQAPEQLERVGLNVRAVRAIVDARARVAALQADAQAMAPRVSRSAALIAKLEKFAMEQHA